MRAAGDAPRVDAALVDAFRVLLEDATLDKAMVARMLDLPSETYVAEQFAQAHPQHIHAAREALRLQLAETLADVLRQVYRALPAAQEYRYNVKDVAQRSLRNMCLSYLMALETSDVYALALTQYEASTHMTDQLAALRTIVHSRHPQRTEVLARFYAQWQQEALVVDQWFAVQASVAHASALAEVRALLSHPAFEMTQPNKVRALIGTYVNGNPAGFHLASGEGYEFLADQVIALNAINPQIAARTVIPLTRWRRFVSPFGERMRAALERVGRQSLSPDVFEQVEKSLRD